VNLYGFHNKDLRNIRVACLCLLCYAGFLRFAELENRRLHHVFIYDNHVKVSEAGNVRIMLKDKQNLQKCILVLTLSIVSFGGQQNAGN
jgi:hypothetical protein